MIDDRAPPMRRWFAMAESRKREGVMSPSLVLQVNLK